MQVGHHWGVERIALQLIEANWHFLNVEARRFKKPSEDHLRVFFMAGETSGANEI
jgi:hypothetical protein